MVDWNEGRKERRKGESKEEMKEEEMEAWEGGMWDGGVCIYLVVFIFVKQSMLLLT